MRHDSVITSYRDHGHMLACGMDPKGVMAELTGRAGGYSKGKGGSMHMFSREKRFFGGHGIVGAQVPLGTGLAFAHKYTEDGGVCLCYLGDGAVNQGQVYESFNMASLWKLPVIYVIENNKYAMGTVDRAVVRRHRTLPARRRLRYPRHAGRRHGRPGGQGGRRDAVAHARGGKGPIILEMKTYRYRGHSMSDPAKYRTKEEVAKMREQHDPIDHLRKQAARRRRRDRRARSRRSTATSRRCQPRPPILPRPVPEPDPAELWTDVLVEA